MKGVDDRIRESALRVAELGMLIGYERDGARTFREIDGGY
jgi:hypothetical protein